MSAQAPPILNNAEVARRVALLAKLQAELAAEGVQSVLVRNRRLVLHAAGSGLEPSGPTDPQLHIYLADETDVVTTDHTSYQFASGPAYPADDPSVVAVTVRAREQR